MSGFARSKIQLDDIASPGKCPLDSSRHYYQAKKFDQHDGKPKQRTEAAKANQNVLENCPYSQDVNHQANQESHPKGPTECFAPGIYHHRKRCDGGKQRGNPFLGNASIVREPGQIENRHSHQNEYGVLEE